MISVTIDGNEVTVFAEVKREKDIKDGVLELKLPKKTAAAAITIVVH